MFPYGLRLSKQGIRACEDFLAGEEDLALFSFWACHDENTVRKGKDFVR